MAEIINQINSRKGKSILQIELSKKELLNLKGKMKKIRIFSKENCLKKEYIKERGNNNTTKYISIPLNYRPKKRNYKKITYCKIEEPKNLFYIYGLVMN